MRIKEMLSHKKSLNILKKTNALLEGHFVLSSGLHSSKYIQCAKLLSHPHLADKICKSLANKIKKNFKSIDLILAPAMGGIIIGYEIGRLLKKETIFCERVNGKFILRRGFHIKKGSKVYGMPTEMESLSIDPFDGSLPDEHYATKKLNKTVTFHKNWLSEKIKIKEKSYTIFYHKYFRNLITETSNVLELNTFQN